MPTLTTLASFNGTNGFGARGDLIADAAGDLFATTQTGGVGYNGHPYSGEGTVFEIAKTAGGYASTPTTLVSFTGADGGNLGGSLIADAAGDLFGTTGGGGRLQRTSRQWRRYCVRNCQNRGRLRQRPDHTCQLQ